MNFSKIKSVHFIGIGGIGMSAIARMFLLEGKKISGSDISDSELLNELRELGARIVIGQSITGVPKDIDLIIYSAAIPVADPELFKVIKKCGAPSISYAEALGVISEGKKTIAVSGTHGKTTTTAMIAKILIDAGLSPTVLIGSLIEDPKTDKQTNFIKGSSEYFLVEADEYQRSFLTLWPSVLVVTNIDADHLDYYHDLSDVQSAFVELAKKVPKDGAIVTDLKNPNVEPVLEVARTPVLDYSSVDITGLALKFPGEHNRQNARAALTVSGFLGVSQEKAVASLNTFKGAWRRFEYKGETANGALVYDDYAHNPQKVRAVLAGAREMFPNKRIVAVFQPHLYSRTKTLLAEFTKSFGDADEIVFLPIFPAREKFDPTISSEILFKKIAEAESKRAMRHIATFDEVVDYLKKTTGKDDVIFTIGAGDVYRIVPALL
ncbi:MAG: UDP-N-acetylmuramate--L-alanine ligase [bacterium]|nr:UDP-N-acetylmuramate--L-alanine ligase [bacterium]